MDAYHPVWMSQFVQKLDLPLTAQMVFAAMCRI